jgi:hypothetical protein
LIFYSTSFGESRVCISESYFFGGSFMAKLGEVDE